VAQLPVWIDSSSSMTAPLIRAALRRIGCEGSLGLVIIDHFHLVQGIGREEQRIRYSNIADDFQRYAKDFDVPLVALCQLNRGAENEKRQPVLSDLKETGKLEENADVVAFLHRPEMFNRHDLALKGIAQVIIAKQREGPIGQVQMQFRHETQTFEEAMDDREDRED
jgi:replicative DNA helicase